VPAARDRVHATAIALPASHLPDGDVPAGAVLIRGPSGSGKSDLALRCLTLPSSPLWSGLAALVADDQVELERNGDTLTASAPPALLGKLEVRGVGILSVPAISGIPVRLVADLAPAHTIERLPDKPHVELLSVQLPQLLIAPHEHSAPIKLLAALGLAMRLRP
jgi:HPr kinase/phosphorylase